MPSKKLNSLFEEYKNTNEYAKKNHEEEDEKHKNSNLVGQNQNANYQKNDNLKIENPEQKKQDAFMNNQGIKMQSNIIDKNIYFPMIKK